MNWSGAKNWLIVLFLGVNIFLIITLINNNIASSTVSDDLVQKTVAVLARNQITIDPALIPRDIPKLGTIEVENNILDMSGLADTIFSGNYTYDAASGQYVSEDSTLTFVGDTLTYTDPTPDKAFMNLNEKLACDLVLDTLKLYGFRMDKASAHAYAADGDNYTVLVEQGIDRYQLLDSRFVAKVSANGILSLEGTWFSASENQGYFGGASSKVKPVTSILIDFISDAARVQNGSTVVTDIDIGYTTGDKSTYHKSVTAMPVWRICTADGHEYYFDAR